MHQRPDATGGPSRPRIGRQLLFWVVLIGCILVALSFVRKAGEPIKKAVDVSAFNKHLKAGDIRRIEVRGSKVIATLHEGRAPYEVIELTITEAYISSHLDEWMTHLPADTKDALKVVAPSGLLPIIVSFLPFLLLILLMVYLFNRQFQAVNARGGGIPFLRNSTEHARKEKPDVTLDDVAGIDEAKEEVKELIDFLKNPEKFQKIGGRIPRGVLLVGHPGTGKTLLAKAIAGEAEVPFFSLCGSDFVELFVGVGAARVRDLFQKARESQPSIIFLDEIDAVGRKRGAGLGGGHDEREQTLNAILSEMDGFTRNEGVIVIAATNRPDVLDHALLRPGRFDREIVVDLPDIKGREAILAVHAGKIKLDEGVNLAALARGTPGFSGADLEAVINEAAILAAVRGKDKAYTNDLEEARDKVRFGRRKKSRVMTDEDRRVTAYHEAGHALVARLNPHVEPIHKVTIMPRGVSLGMTMILPEKDKYTMSRNECLGTLAMNLAGRVAEELFCDDISSGAQNDIEIATKLARKMVTQWGMDEKLGPVSYSDEEEHVFLGTEITRGKKYSEKTAEHIDEEIATLLRRAYEEARRLCKEHAAELETIAASLLRKETLTAEDIKAIFSGATVEEIVKAPVEAMPEHRPEEGKEPEKEGGPGEMTIGDLPHPAGSPA